MTSLSAALSLAHLVGLALGMGGASVKLTLLLKCSSDHGLLAAYGSVAKLITRHIVGGMVLLVVSGIGWLLLGRSLSTALAVKLALVLAAGVLGLVIDNVVEPRLHRLAPRSGEPASPAFLRVQRQHLALEAAATALLYGIVALWVLG